MGAVVWEFSANPIIIFIPCHVFFDKKVHSRVVSFHFNLLSTMCNNGFEEEEAQKNCKVQQNFVLLARKLNVFYAS
jgi:hypothetical protein